MIFLHPKYLHSFIIFRPTAELIQHLLKQLLLRCSILEQSHTGTNFVRIRIAEDHHWIISPDFQQFLCDLYQPCTENRMCIVVLRFIQVLYRKIRSCSADPQSLNLWEHIPDPVRNFLSLLHFRKCRFIGFAEAITTLLCVNELLQIGQPQFNTKNAVLLLLVMRIIGIHMVGDWRFIRSIADFFFGNAAYSSAKELK